MKLIIARPQDWINKSKNRTAKIWFYDVEALYDNILAVCKELNLDFKERTDVTPGQIIERPNTIFIGHHTFDHNRSCKNVWHIKKGYIPGYMYFDKYGYSGWSELAYEYNNPRYTSKAEKQKIIEFCSEYINNNTSKIKQPDSCPNLKKPYVLVLCQRPHDTVAKFSYIDTIKLSHHVTEAFKDSEYTVYVKPHPMHTKQKLAGNIVNGSMHKMIKDATAIYTVNSGSGFESLMHFKKVYTTGNCDYKWMTTQLKTFEEIKDSVKTVDYNPEVYDRYTDFLYYCFNEHFVNCYDKESVKKKLQRVVNEYEV